MIVGEQPGNAEDLEGKPFVGPAGRLLSQLFEDAGIDPEKVYITNAVKHFKWVARGKLRIHQKPNAREINACRYWLEAEVAAISPTAILCLGTTATAGVFGRAMRIGQNRQHVFTDNPLAKAVTMSWHPSAILRAITAQARQQKLVELLEDLKLAWRTAQM